MENILAHILYEKKILNIGTNIEVKYLGIGLDGTFNVPSTDFFVITNIIDKNGSLELKISSKDDYTKLITPSSIIGIEGMNIERFALSYNIKPNGSNSYKGKKRGRKRNIKLEKI